MATDLNVKSGKNIWVNCDWCGAERRMRPYQFKKAKLHFCNNKCKRDYQRTYPDKFQSFSKGDRKNFTFVEKHPR